VLIDYKLLASEEHDIIDPTTYSADVVVTTRKRETAELIAEALVSRGYNVGMWQRVMAEHNA
jgi:type IV secretory pathway TraG/TraD family ATPase VirD4